MVNDPRLSSPAAARNRGPILEALRARWKRGDRVLEVASGTGEHAAFIAPKLGVHWQPSDIEESALCSIAAWCDHSEIRSWVSPPLRLDVAGDWPSVCVDWIYSSNLIHISPIEVTRGLFFGARQVLEASGGVVLYGPFFRDEVATAPSNLAFDESLRARDCRFGIRDLAAVDEIAMHQGFARIDLTEMPANNLLVTYRREKDTSV